MPLLRIVMFATVVLMLNATPSLALDFKKVKADLREASGVLIMAAEDEYLVDLDATSGSLVGDLVAVVQDGEKIVHPVTNEVLGSLQSVKAVLKITRLETGYSFAKVVRQAEGQDLRRGDVVKRFAGLKAAFWDYAEGGEKIFEELKDAAPGLKWVGYEIAQQEKPHAPGPRGTEHYDLIFVLTNDGLVVRDGAFGMVRSYHHQPTAATKPLPVSKGTAIPAAAPSSASPAAQAEGAVSWDRGSGAKGHVFDADFPGFANLGSLPRGTLMADFAQSGEDLLVVTTDGGAIQVFRYDGTLEKIAEGDTLRPGKILSIHWWRPTVTSPLYVAATVSVELDNPGAAFVGYKPIGALFSFDGQALEPVREGLPFMLGAFDLDVDGTNEVLLGQEFDRDVFYGQVKELRLVDGEVQSLSPSVAIPHNFTVQGSVISDLDDDGQPELAWVNNRVLNIYSRGERVYESNQEMGGTLSQMSYSSNPAAKESSLTTTAFEIPPVAYDLDGDGVPELFSVASEGDFLKAPGVGPGIKKSWLAVLKHRQGMYVKGSLGDEMDLPLQGLTIVDDRVYLVATAPASWLGKPGQSHLLSFSMSR